MTITKNMKKANTQTKGMINFMPYPNPKTFDIMVRGIQHLNDINTLRIKMNLPLWTGFICEQFPISEIKIPKFQRKHGWNKIRKLIKNYNFAQLDIKKAFYDPNTGCVYLWDGYHTLDMLKEMGEVYMPLVIFPLMTDKEAAIEFAYQAKLQTRMSCLDSFAARVYGEEEAAAEIDACIKEYGLSRGPNPNYLMCKRISSTRKLEMMYKCYGIDVIAYTFKLIMAADWGGESHSFIENALHIGFIAYECDATEDSCEYMNLLNRMKEAGNINDFRKIATAWCVMNHCDNKAQMHSASHDIETYVKGICLNIED